MITLEKVNKYFNYRKRNEIHVINDTSLEFGESGLIALLGPSGCGKTTLLNSISGLDNIKSGYIYINKERISNRPSYEVDRIRNLNIGYIFQNYYLINDKTVFENVAISLLMLGLKDKKEIERRVNNILKMVGIYRYRNKLVSNLSGGERQRVGIARAIVKDPKIIIADEPTGNLDSSNTISIMNIIKKISKDRLVILVTHEMSIAKFYADRVIELEDGKVVKDYLNENVENLDYKMDNKIYLKDFKNIDSIKKNDNEIKIYSNSDDKLNISIIVKNNNIYIKTDDSFKVESIDDDSNIELINDHYKAIDKAIFDKETYEIEKLNFKPKYTSIFTPFSNIVNGFKKLKSYSVLKKILLLGFFFAGCFITYCVSNLCGITDIKDSYFITKNKEYYKTSLFEDKMNKYNQIANLNSVDYVIPGDSLITFNVHYDRFFQTQSLVTYLKGSLTDVNKLSNDDIIEGRLPQNNREIVVDVATINNMLENGEAKLTGVYDYKYYLNREVEMDYVGKFKIVGFTNIGSPSIYAYEDMFINLIYYSSSYYSYNMDYVYEVQMSYADGKYGDSSTFVNYDFVKDTIKLEKGRTPNNDYEILVHIDYEYSYELNSNITINEQKFKIVGFYSNYESTYIANSNTIKKCLINDSNVFSIMPNSDSIHEDIASIDLNILSYYDMEKTEYETKVHDSLNAALIACFVVLTISFIEIYLMIRSSFLSRIKEVGIYRAIGVKKIDLYKMFFGEIFAITTITCLPGVLFMSYALNGLLTIEYFSQNYAVNVFTIIISIGLIYLFNMIVGLIPVYGVIKDTPAKILARKDIE